MTNSIDRNASTKHKPGDLGHGKTAKLLKPAPAQTTAKKKAKPTPGEIMKKLSEYEWDYEAMGRA